MTEIPICYILFLMVEYQTFFAVSNNLYLQIGYQTTVY